MLNALSSAVFSVGPLRPQQLPALEPPFPPPHRAPPSNPLSTSTFLPNPRIQPQTPSPPHFLNRNQIPGVDGLHMRRAFCHVSCETAAAASMGHARRR